MLFLVCLPISAQFTCSFTINKDDFRLVAIDDSNNKIIDSNKFEVYYAEDVNASVPNPLPNVFVRVAIPIGTTVNSCEISYNDEVVITDNINLTTPGLPIPIGFYDEPSSANLKSPLEDYQPMNYVESYCYGIPYVSIRISPFRYSEKGKSLSICEDITIDLSIMSSGRELTKVEYQNLNDNASYLKQLVVNPECIDEFVAQYPIPTYYQYPVEDYYDYVIITSEDLMDAFVPLAQWKTVKGLRSLIVSVEEIHGWYQGNTIQEQIKHCLYDLFLSYRLKYAVLGGDDTIVPDQKCFVRVSGTDKNGNYVCYEGLTPADNYYACFGGQFNWDGNDNGICGEVGDDIDFHQYIDITRIPVRSRDDVKSYIDKLINYESCKNSDRWNEMFVISGKKLWNYYDGISDAQLQGSDFWKKHIQNYWQGDYVQFFDTYSDYDFGEVNYPTPSNLNYILSDGPMFLSMMTHGHQTYWELGKNGVNIKYYPSAVSSIKNYGSTIITTMACFTNAFDTFNAGFNNDSFLTLGSDPSLSESFIRSHNSGVVAYIGSSRYGWGQYGIFADGPSQKYEGKFYDKLFEKENFSFKHLGDIVKYAKEQYSESSRYEGANRWLQMSLNPLGDAEMPIFTTLPKMLKMQITRTDSIITIMTSPSRCIFSVANHSSENITLYESKESSSGYTFKLDGRCTMCVTAPGYKPIVFGMDIVGDKVVWGDATPTSKGIKLDLNYSSPLVGSYSISYPFETDFNQRSDIQYFNIPAGMDNNELNNLNDCSSYAIIYNSLGEIISSQNLLDGCELEMVDTGNLSKGFYIIAYFESGKYITSKKILKQ